MFARISFLLCIIVSLSRQACVAGENEPANTIGADVAPLNKSPLLKTKPAPPLRYAVVVVGLRDGGPADKAQTGDIITSLGGQPIRSLREFNMWLSKTKSGDVANVAITRRTTDGEWREWGTRVTVRTLAELEAEERAEAEWAKRAVAEAAAKTESRRFAFDDLPIYRGETELKLVHDEVSGEALITGVKPAEHGDGYTVTLVPVHTCDNGKWFRRDIVGTTVDETTLYVSLAAQIGKEDAASLASGDHCNAVGVVEQVSADERGRERYISLKLKDFRLTRLDALRPSLQIRPYSTGQFGGGS
jgi:hypothetical protein